MNKLLLNTSAIIIAGIASIYQPDTLHALPHHVVKHHAVVAKSKWLFKRQVELNNEGTGAKDAVVQIQLNSQNFDYTKAQSNGADLRFSAGSKLSGEGLSYWIEQWNDNGISTIWVKVPALKSKGQTKMNLYYGNTEAQPASNGNTTFLFFDDFEDGDYSKKWTNVSIGEVVEKGGILKLKESDGQDGIISANFELSGKMIVRTLYQREGGDQHWTRAGVGGWNNWFCFGDHTDFAGTGTNYIMFYDANSLSSLTSAPLSKTANTVINDKWRSVAYWFDGENIKGMQDNTSLGINPKPGASKLSLRTLDNDAWDNFAFVTVSNYSGPNPLVTLGEQQSN